ncbi:hypothetical protein Syun_022570 [Stephania yunnanensis]|uniref:Uncharacterized protein n=1 Tax=Stephania yunnanensis TaxID=152371 RepID=A0AAP0I392_9MAGN
MRRMMATSTSAWQCASNAREQRGGVVGPIGCANRRMSTTRLRDLGCYSQVSGAHIEMRASACLRPC